MLQRKKREYPYATVICRTDERYAPLGLFRGEKIYVLRRVRDVMLIKARCTVYAIDGVLLGELLGVAL